MLVLDPQDRAYVAAVTGSIERNDLSAITFWLTTENEFIGTSLVYGSAKLQSARYWVPASTQQPHLCKNRWEMLFHIRPRKGIYLLYMQEEGKWNLISQGSYDHTLVDFYKQGLG